MGSIASLKLTVMVGLVAPVLVKSAGVTLRIFGGETLNRSRCSSRSR
jgi:hypothetical protein